MKTLAFLIALVVFALQAHAATVTGELRKWHKVTLDFAGPATSESATPNPFTNYRLNVTFRHAASGKTYLVPGYYAADGNAANTSASSGNVWRAHFAPDETGTWTYDASFRSGTNVATDSNATAGSSAGFFDGDSGSFTITATNKSGIDFRGKGRLDYVGKHHLRFAETGEYFMKAGVDAPENLLAYADFDGDFKTDGNEDALVKTWSAHVADWQSGDPVWQGTKGKGLIGAVNYLAAEGLNAFSFLTMNINGDDKNVFPYTSYSERSRMDVSKLDQWELVFEHGTRKGMHLHFKTQEIENQNLLDGGDLGSQRKLYYRELIARFGHHPALNWNLGEECTATTARKTAWAQYFHDSDPYHHPIVIHNTTSVLHRELMGDASKLTGFSLQLNASDFTDMFAMTKDYIDRSAATGKPWVVACDEPGDSQYSLRPDNNAASSHTNARKNALWGNIMAGGAGCEFYFGYALEHSDLTCQDFRSRDSFWDYCRHALAFVKSSGVPFQDMTNQNSLVSGSGANANRCLAKTGESYLVHLPSGGSATLNLSGVSGSFHVRWFDPRNGGALITGNTVNGGGTVNLGSPPNSTTLDWVALLQDDTGLPPVNQAPIVSAGPDKSATLSGTSVSVALSGSASDDGLPEGSSLTRSWTRISGPAAVTFADASSASTTASFTATGTYTLRLSATDGELSSSDDMVVTITNSPPSNQAPVANAGPDLTATLNSTSVQVALNGSASDDGLPAGSSLAIAWTRLSGPAAVTFGNPSAPATTATFTAIGTYVLRLSASDGDLSHTDDVQVVVSASSGGGQTFVPTHDAYLQDGANVNNGDLRAETTSRVRVSYLQFDLSSLGGPASSARLTLTESNEPSGGTITLRMFAASSNNWTESGITGSNAPAKGAQIATFTGDIADGESVEFDVSSFVSGPGIYSFIMEVDAGYRDIAFASSENVATADRPVLNVTISNPPPPPNAAPVVNAGPDQSAVLSGASVNVALAGSATDDGLPAGSTLTNAWTRVSGPAAVSFSSAATPSTTVTFTATGTYVLRLSSSDGSLSASDDVTVTITAGNSAPIVNAGPDKSAVLAETSVTVTLTGSASDDGQPTGSLTVAWSRISGPAPVTFSNAASAVTDATFTATGTYLLRLTASDGSLSSTDDVSVVIDPSSPSGGQVTFAPTHDAYLQDGVNYNNGDLRAETTSRIRVSYLQFDLSSLGGSASAVRLKLTESSDTSGGTITLRMFAALSSNWTESGINGSNAPAKGAQIAIFTGDITDGMSVEFDVGSFVTGPGIYSFIMEVDAGFRDVAFASSENVTTANRPVLNVTMSSSTPPPNASPVVNAGPDQSAVLSGASVSVELGGSATDDGLPADSTLTSAWTRISGPAAVAFSPATSPSTTATFTATGTYLLRLASSDGALSASDDVTVTITASNSAPTVNAGPDKSAVLAGGSVAMTISGSATDDGQPASSTLTVAWSPISGPAPVTFSNAASAVTDATFTATGTYVLRLTASDGSLSSTDDVSVVINPSSPGGGQASFLPTHDAYTENGSNFNTSSLRVESSSRKRISYLQFDLRSLTSGASAAILRLTEDDDVSSGSVTLRLHAASSNNWTESTINGSNAPAKNGEIAVVTSDVSNGKLITLDVSSAVSGPGIYSFILEVDASALDVAFASSENSIISARPSLQVTTGTASASAPSAAMTAFVETPMPTSSLQPVLERTATNLPRLSVTGVAGARYVIERSEDLETWSVVETITADEDGLILYTDPSPPPDRAFYRVSDP